MRVSGRSLWSALMRFLEKLPVNIYERGEAAQVRIFTKVLFYLFVFSVVTLPLQLLDSSLSKTAIGRLIILLLFLTVSGIGIFLNKKGKAHISRSLFQVVSVLILLYISYREGHPIGSVFAVTVSTMTMLMITPQRRRWEVFFAILIPFAALLCMFFVEIPWIKPVVRTQQDTLFVKIGPLSYFLIFCLIIYISVRQTYYATNQLVAKIKTIRQIQHQLIEQSKTLRIAQQLANVGFWEFTADGTPIWSKEAYKILQAPTGAKINRALIENIVHPDDLEFVLQNLLRITQNGGISFFSFRLHPEHGERWIAVSCTEAISIQGKEFFHSKGIVQDITFAKQAEQELIRTIEAKDRVLATVSHDLRSPIATTLQLAELAQVELDKSQALRNLSLVNDYHRMIVERQKHTMHMIEDLLTQAVAKNEKPFTGKRTDLCTLVEQVVNPQMFRAGQKNIQLDFVTAKNDIIINAVPDKIARALENLIVNAIKFTPMGGKITVSVEKSEGFALIAVADTGIGIPDHLKEHLFEQFGAARRYGTEGESSTGLGLSIVKQWVEMHKGTVWCEDNKPHGTVFYMSFPLAEEDNATASRGMDDDSQAATTF